MVALSEVGPAGHPNRGGFLPPVPLPRRMWAGGAINFVEPLRVGDAVTMHGPSGPETVEVIDIKYPEERPGLCPGPAGAVGPRRL